MREKGDTQGCMHATFAIGACWHLGLVQSIQLFSVEADLTTAALRLAPSHASHFLDF
jgi:hypothetical protein